MQLSEDTVLDQVEKLCDPRKEAGYWIRGLDIEEVGGQVKLVEQDGKKGSCRRECQTLAKACEETVSEVDTDLAESLYRGKLSVSQTINKVCYELTDACTKKTPYKRRKFNEVFEETSDKDLEMERLMSEMGSVCFTCNFSMSINSALMQYLEVCREWRCTLEMTWNT